MGNVKNEPTFNRVQCCTKLLIWIKPEILQGFRWLTRIRMYSIIIPVISFLISEVEQVKGFGFKISCGRTFYFCNKQQRDSSLLLTFKLATAG